MPDQWKQPAFYLMLLATAIAMVLAIGLVAPDSVAGKLMLVVSGLLNAAGIKASSVSVANAYMTPAPGQPAVQVQAAAVVVPAGQPQP